MLDLEKLTSLAEKTANDYLAKDKLGQDEELQLLSAAYSVLFLKACGQKKDQFANAHDLISRSFVKIADSKYSDRHLKLAKAYRKN